jgi:hypothetical protein
MLHSAGKRKVFPDGAGTIEPDTFSPITFAICRLSVHPPHLLMVKSPGENVLRPL